MIWRRQQTDIDSLSTYSELLLRLHYLVREGQGDSTQADQLRDEMDAPWSGLNAKQLRLIDGLSEDLYSKNRNNQSGVAEAEAHAEFDQAVADEKWDVALDVVRNTCFAPQTGEFLRGVCWTQLHQPKVAAEFFDRAAQKGALRAEEEVWKILSFVEAGRSQEVLARSQEILSCEEEPLLRFAAGHVLFDLAGRGSVEHRDAIVAAHQTLDIVKQRGTEAPSLISPELLNLQRGALLHLAMSYDELGDTNAAVDACQEALKLSPEDMNALLLLGWLTADPNVVAHDSLRPTLRRELTAFDLTPLSKTIN